MSERNPFRIEPPFVVSFSGGRTSGFMLYKILEAYDGKLPEDSRVCFQNTGLEHEITYRFVEEVGKRWCPVVWLEYRPDAPYFAVVNFVTANRTGRPFSDLIGKRHYLPNPVTRFCTQEMKIVCAERYLASEGWAEWDNAVGFRADEMRRVAKKRENVVCPLAEAGYKREDVDFFWSAQDFDLGFPPGDHAAGNCVGCFLKGTSTILNLMREMPEQFAWWVAQEKRIGATFRKDRPPYEKLLEMARTQGCFSFMDDETIPCMCTE